MTEDDTTGATPQPVDPEKTKSGPSSEASPSRPQGGMRFQDSASTTAREPTLAEQRERARVRREAEEAARRQAEQDAADDSKRRRRKKQLIGGGVAVGLVAVVAAGYLASRPGGSYEDAHCVDENGVVVADSYCSNSGSGISSGGMFFFYGLGGQRYQYYYGGSSAIGQKATGGALTPSSGKSYANTSGKAVTSDGKTGGAVSRGGFGTTSGGGTSGKSGGTSSGG